MMSTPFVKTRIHEESVDSTSDLARAIVSGGDVALPLVVSATRQTRGRGRGDHAWWSDAGSLTFTLVIDPGAHGLLPRHEPRLALASAVAVIDAVAPLLPHELPGIRWPNDIEVGGRKLGGLLPERIETDWGPRLAIGFGLNVLTRLADAPPEVARMAVSLADLSPVPLSTDDLVRVLESILGRFESVLGLLAADAPDLAARWDRLDTLRDLRVRVDLGPRIVEGLGRGIDAEGALRLADDRGISQIFGGQVLRHDG